MKMYLISDNIDTLTGMRLAGVEVAAGKAVLVVVAAFLILVDADSRVSSV